MARRFPFITSMAAGELAEEYLLRTDLQVRNEGARRFRNALNMAGGGFKRRWGTADVAGLNGVSRLETYGIGRSDARLLVFGDGRFEVRGLDGAVQQVIATAVPWREADLFTMQIAIEDGKVVVAARSFQPQILTLTGSTWAIAPLAFADGLNGSRLQPYWRYAARGISLSPSGYSGAINLATSADFFLPSHVGTRIRYTGVEIQIAGVSSPTAATGNVIGALYPTVTVTLASSDGFIIGQQVKGEDTQINGVVSAVPSATTLQIQMIDGFTLFDATEALVGPTARSKMSAVTNFATPAPTVDWDEALIGGARGYPGSTALHRNRLMLGDFDAAQNVMAASATGDIEDFSTGTGLETDAIIERVGRETSLGLRHFGSTEQLLLFTEAGVYYVPEQVAAPLSPTNFELLKIGPESAASPQPLLVSEGMMFIERDSGRTMICLPTGNVRRSWEIADLSELAFHLMGTPIELELLAAGTESDRLVPVLRDDGQMAVLTYRRSAQFSAWSLWHTAGSWRSLVVADGQLFVVAERVVDGVRKFRLERFDETAWADGMVALPDLNTPVPLYAGHTIGVWSGPSKLGEFEVGPDGRLIGVDDSFGAVRVGLDFPLIVEGVPPIDQQMGLRPNYKITRVDVDVIESVGFKGNGRDPSGWSGVIGGEVTPTTGVRRFRPLGRAKYPTFTIEQHVGGPLEVRTITMEVTS
ncbi:hypothetical protein [Brevundimonas sp.]|uniref:hypothetical protein n=1 Tax=Brevundimonas sp. TaxID=1871086 RepID=UPI0025C373C7|nr:hypothetical protein [Brevundimonas sp.]